MKPLFAFCLLATLALSGYVTYERCRDKFGPPDGQPIRVDTVYHSQTDTLSAPADTLTLVADSHRDTVTQFIENSRVSSGGIQTRAAPYRSLVPGKAGGSNPNHTATGVSYYSTVGRSALVSARLLDSVFVAGNADLSIFGPPDYKTLYR